MEDVRGKKEDVTGAKLLTLFYRFNNNCSLLY